MKDYHKFLKRLPKPLRNKLIKAIEKIAANNLKTPDIKSLSGKGQFHRCHVGKIRIIFIKGEFENEIIDIGYRGDIY